jgi:O-acetyl-ADP-ribose deacetylase (regulator of RNase III)
VIEVVVDDLAFVAADAILRPADDWLGPLTPAMTRVDQQAGARFAELRTVQSPLQAGAAVVTRSGDLSAPFVVHLVLQDEHEPGSPALVRRALRAAWQQAAAWQLERLATPLVGAGPGRLSDEESAELLAESFLAAGGQADAPRVLQIVVERPDERDLVEAIIARYRR